MAVLNMLFADGGAEVARGMTFENTPEGLFGALIAMTATASHDIHAAHAVASCVTGRVERPQVHSLVAGVDAFARLPGGTAFALGDSGEIRFRGWLAADVLGGDRSESINVLEFGRAAEPFNYSEPDLADDLLVAVAGYGAVHVGNRLHVLAPGSAVLLTHQPGYSLVPDAERPLRVVVCHIPATSGAALRR